MNESPFIGEDDDARLRTRGTAQCMRITPGHETRRIEQAKQQPPGAPQPPRLVGVSTVVEDAELVAASRVFEASLAQKEEAPMHPRDEAGWDMCGLESGTDAGESDNGTSTSSFDHIMSSKLSDPAASELRELFVAMQAEMQQLRRHNQVRRASQPGQAWSLEWL